MLVLIVDDNQGLAENIAEILEMQGYVTSVATSAEEALPKALEETTNVLITDYRLPGMTGAELVGLLQKKAVRIRAVVISAYTDEGTIAAARNAGAAFLPKPVDFSDLSRLIGAVSA